MAIYTGRMQQDQEKRNAARRIAKQQEKAEKGEAKRKGRAGRFGKLGGLAMGTLAVGAMGLTGGLAAPLVMGVASSLGKKWADEASKKGVFKTPGQVDKIKADGKYGYGVMAAADATKALKESRKTEFGADTMLGDIAGSYLSAGLSGELTGGAKSLVSGDKGSIAKALGGKQGAVGGWEGVKQAAGLFEFGTDSIMDYKSLEGTMSPEKYDALVASRQEGYTEPEDFWDTATAITGGTGFDDVSVETDWAQGGQVPQMDQNTMIGLAILSQMQQQQQQTAYDNTPLEEVKKPSISEYFGSQNKTLGGSSTKSISQLMGR